MITSMRMREREKMEESNIIKKNSLVLVEHIPMLEITFASFVHQFRLLNVSIPLGRRKKRKITTNLHTSVRHFTISHLHDFGVADDIFPSSTAMRCFICTFFCYICQFFSVIDFRLFVCLFVRFVYAFWFQSTNLKWIQCIAIHIFVTPNQINRKGLLHKISNCTLDLNRFDRSTV